MEGAAGREPRGGGTTHGRDSEGHPHGGGKNPTDNPTDGEEGGEPHRHPHGQGRGRPPTEPQAPPPPPDEGLHGPHRLHPTQGPAHTHACPPAETHVCTPLQCCAQTDRARGQVWGSFISP